MRPLTLRIEGLRSYLGEQTIDFRDKQLLAIVGDTGAGKSSILEALCFALYGTSSWSNKAVKELISHGRDVMQVELSFVADGHEWTCLRTASRGAYPRPVTKLACPALDIKLDKKREVDNKLVELVGLEYDAFLRAVILPQGRFQKLLQATASERASILKNIFRLDLLDQMREWADAWRTERTPRLTTMREARARLHDDPAAEAARAAADIARLDAEAKDLARARESCAAATAGERAAGERVQELERALGAVSSAPGAALLERLDELERAAAGIDQRLAHLAEELDALERQSETVRAELAAGANSGLDLAGLTKAETDIERALELSQAAASKDAEAGTLTDELAATDALLTEREAAHEEAVRTANAAREELERARRAESAAHLATHLTPGESCPVCRQDVPASFRAPKAKPRALTQAEKSSSRADKGEKTAQKAAHDAATASRDVQGALERARSAADQARAEVQARIAGLAEPIRPASAERSALEAARANARTRLADLRARTERSDALEIQLRRARDARHAVENERTDRVRLPLERAHAELAKRAESLSLLAALAGAPAPPPLARDAADVSALRAYAANLQERAERLATAAEALARAAESERATHAAAAEAILDQAACRSLAELDARIGRAHAQREAAETEHLEATAQIERAADLDRRIAEAGGLLDAVEELKKLLADGKFVSYAVERKQEALLAVASQLLGDMTDGRFGFAADFQIVDKRAGEARSTDTLSGGETFLASLALALALVELANRAGGRLDALFLDEGFGALDADALEQAVQALAAQSRRGRLVVVISHLQAVAENIEHVLLVESTPMGSRARVLDPGERSRFDLGSSGLVA